MSTNVIIANFRGVRQTVTDPLWQWDYGQILRFSGITLPETFEVHFSNDNERGEATTMIGTDNEVLIPDVYLTTGRNIFVWIFLHVGEDDGETEFKAQIPVNKRAMPADDPPTPQEQSAITQAIAALNSAVVDVQEAVDAADSARASATSAASSATAAAASEAGVEADADRASTAATAAESAQTAAEAAQAGAETAQTGAESARDEAAQASVAQIAQINATGAAVLESIPADYTELSDSVRDLKSEIDDGEYIDSTFYQGGRNASGTIVPSSNRVTSKVFQLNQNDVISVSNVPNGYKFAIAGGSYDSGWKTSDFAYTALASIFLFVNFATSTGSENLTPTDINAIITIKNNNSVSAKNKIEISAINNTLPYDISASAEGYQLYKADAFSLGQYENGSAGTYYQNRIRFISPQTAPKQIVLESLNDNIDFSVALYDNVDTFLYQSAYVKKYVVESGKKYAITIRDITKTDHTVKADIYELRSKVGFYTAVTEEINNAKQGNFVIDLACIEMENGNINPNGTETTDEYNALRKLRTVNYYSVPSGAIIHNSNTTLRFGVVFFNSSHKSLGSSGWISDENYTIENACLIRIIIGLRSDNVLPEYMKLTYRSDFAIEYSSDSLVNSVLSMFGELKPNAGTYSYTGQPINLWKKTYNIEKLWTYQHATTEGTYNKQASAYYGGLVFKCYSNNLLQLYNFETGELLNEFPIISEHGQTIEFSNEFYSANDEFPLAYISSIYRDDCAVYVNRITRTGATLVRTLTFPRQTVGLSSQCILDTMNNALYKIGWKSDTDYQTPADGNCMIVTKWDLNNLHDNGDGTYTPEFIKKFETAFIDTLQGNVVFDGRAYIVSSNPYTPKTKVYVLDLGAEEYTNILTEFIEPIRDHEAEGIFFVPDGEKYAMIIDVQSTGLYKLTF